MKSFLIGALTLCFSSALLAQADTAPAETVPPGDSSAGAVSSEVPGDAAPSAESAEDRIQRECREWAVQDGVPVEELPTYINDCVEDRQVQE